MARITRKTQKIFGENAPQNQITTFGSIKDGTPVYSQDVSAIQTTAFTTGWSSAVTDDYAPYRQDRNAVDLVTTKQLAYLFQDGIAEWDSATTYFKGGIVKLILGTEVSLYKSLTDNNVGNALTNTTYWEELSFGGGMPIGSFTSIPCTADYIPDGCLPCDGTEYTKAQFTTLWTNYLTSSPVKLQTCTYADFNSSLTTYGQCGKFALDTTNEKFKTPYIKDGAYLTQARTDAELGKAYNESLPNITGGIDGRSNAGTANGAFIRTASISGAYAGTGGNNEATFSYNFNASRSSSTYQDNAKVQGDNIRTRYFVVVANAQINQSQMDWSAWASSLAGKMNTDLSNITATGKETVVGWGMPDYDSNKVIESLALNITYTRTFPWYATVSFNCLRSNEQLIFTINGVTQRYGGQVYNNASGSWDITIPIAANIPIIFTQGNGFSAKGRRF